MTDKPKALELAKAIRTHEHHPQYCLYEKAAAELRRLHEVNQALVEALEELSLYVAHNGDDWVQRKAQAALAKAKEST